jgi:glycerol-3-phosphate acyltransferase PlsY
MERIICLVMGYIFGLFQTGYIYGKMHGIDIRESGSGNSGTTNALRVLGKQAGLIVLIGDIGKCIIACLLCRFLFGSRLPDMELLLVLYTGVGVILGHNFPFYMNFKGGKGIAATGGLVISVFDVRIFVISI